MNGESNKKVRLFMKMRNNGGTKKDPCETPAVTPVQAEKVTPVLTHRYQTICSYGKELLYHPYNKI